MIFTKTTEYAIRVMVFLADNKEKRYSVNSLHQRLNIPYKYLGRLMSKLAVAEFVNVSQGKQGGYQLNLKRSPIYLHEIINLVEGLENYDRCILGFNECSEENPCSMHHVWAHQKDKIRNIIYNTTLDDIDNVKNVKY